VRYVVIHPGGERYGPVELSELQRWVDDGRVLPETQVEESSSGRFAQARDVAGLRFAANATPPHLRPQAYFRPGMVEPVPNHLTKAILSTLCCCLPLGVVAIVYAAQVQGFASTGNADAAWESSRKADLWGNVSIGLGILSACAYAGLRGAAGM